MRRLKIQRVKRVPPIPTISIVIPKVQLSICIRVHLLMISGEVMKQHVVTSPRYGLESSLTDQAGGGFQKGETPSKEEYKTEKGFLSSCRTKLIRLNAGSMGSESNHKLLLGGR